ncbi:MAG: hypothetical protein AAFV88_14260, partial [Planctomycetota bacterium]
LFSVAVAWIQCGDLIRENPVGYFASDGRATYMFFFYLAIRFHSHPARTPSTSYSPLAYWLHPRLQS